MKQAESASHMRELLIARGVDIPSRSLSLPDGQRWLVFERNGRQVGIDSMSGIWLRESAEDTWHCVATLHTMSGALLALDFLTEDMPLT